MAGEINPTSQVGIAQYEFNLEVPTQMYDESFRNVIEAHVPYLRNQHSKHVSLTDYLVYIKNYDFYGLLYAMNLPPIVYFATLRVNNLSSITDDISDRDYILVPDEGEIQRIFENELTRNRK